MEKHPGRARVRAEAVIDAQELSSELNWKLTFQDDTINKMDISAPMFPVSQSIFMYLKLPLPHAIPHFTSLTAIFDL